jgi:hypothetical protein
LCEPADCASSEQCVQDGTCDEQTGECIPGDSKALDSACTEGGGAVCDGSGNCVGCNNDSQCEPDENCVFSDCRDDRVLFRDETFLDRDWALRMFVWQNGGSGSATQSPDGGNPGEHRRIVTHHNGSNYPNPATGVYALSLKDGAVFNPSTKGEIMTIDYSEDAMAFERSQGTGPALRQDGNYYVSSAGSTSSDTWQLIQSGLLTAADFALITDGVGLDETMHPDFSSTGPEIQFGFYRATGCKWASGTGFPCGPNTQEAGIDNWEVLVRYSPSP